MIQHSQSDGFHDGGCMFFLACRYKQQHFLGWGHGGGTTRSNRKHFVSKVFVCVTCPLPMDPSSLEKQSFLGDARSGYLAIGCEGAGCEQGAWLFFERAIWSYRECYQMVDMELWSGWWHTIAVSGGSSCPITHQPAVSGFCFCCPYFCHTRDGCVIGRIAQLWQWRYPVRISFACVILTIEASTLCVSISRMMVGWSLLWRHWNLIDHGENMPNPNYMTHKLLINPT